MVFGFGLSLTAIKTLSAVQRAINILKSAGPGAWYDPSDLATLFQDSAGTTPVTAVEQPVGLMLDKSKGLVLGAELVATPSWAAPAIGGAAFSVFATGGSYVANKTYLISATVSGYAGTGTVGFVGSGALNGNATPVISGNGTISVVAPAVSNADMAIQLFTRSTNTATFSNISVRELPGSHLIQPTATSRPTLSSRYNLLTKTEQFDDAVWVKTNATVTANAAVAPDGTLTADKVISTAVSGEHYVEQVIAATVNGQYVQSCDVKVDITIPFICFAPVAVGTPYTVACWFIRNTAGVLTHEGNTPGIDSYSIEEKANGWYRLTVRYTLSGTVTSHRIRIYSLSTAVGTGPLTGDGTSGIYVWGASLVPASDAALPYQRVNTATDYDYDFSKFPPFLRFDGVDDGMYSAASVDFTSTDKMTVFAGVHKASDAAVGLLAETSTGALSGSFWLSMPATVGGPNVLFQSKGTIDKWAITSSLAAPLTRVVTGIGDISGDRVTLRLNGTQTSQDATDQGTGNYGNYPLYVGRRNNASLPFNGRIYQLAIKGKALSAAEISTVEALINSRTKAF